MDEHTTVDILLQEETTLSLQVSCPACDLPVPVRFDAGETRLFRQGRVAVAPLRCPACGWSGTYHVEQVNDEPGRAG